jgi:hypothetical protein
MKHFSKHKSKQKHNITKKSHKIQGHIIAKKEGWNVIHIYGNAFDRGFAHGALLSCELLRIQTVILPFLVKKYIKIPFAKYMQKSNRTIKPIIAKKFPEFYQEICGISQGAYQMGKEVTIDFLIAWNSFLTLYDVFGFKKNQRCSAFIACGNATETGEIILAHNTHSDFVSGSILNIVLYITPENGLPFVMQTSPGLIASSADWFLCSSGIIGCETTISGINYKPQLGVPYFCRIRQAMQYGRTLDDYIEIMMKDNAGDYPGSWLLGDTTTGEIMRFELGLKEHNIQRTSNGVFYGMNGSLGLSKEIKKDETGDITTSIGSRNCRLNELLNKTYYGKITTNLAKQIISDHHDTQLKKTVMNSRGICNHSELHSQAKPFGCTDGKVVDSQMAKRLSFLGRFGSACGRHFIVDDFLKKHPKYQDWNIALTDLPTQKWTEISSGK